MFKDIDYYDKGNIILSEKCNVDVIKQYPIIKFLIEKDDWHYVYINYHS